MVEDHARMTTEPTLPGVMGGRPFASSGLPGLWRAYGEDGRGAKEAPRIELEWVLRFQQGDMAAFEAIFNHERLRMSRFIYNFVRSQDVVEDIFQDVWAEAWLHRSKLRKPESFLGWLYGITRRRIALHHRKKHQRFRLVFFGDASATDEVTREMEDKSPGPDEIARSKQWQQVFDEEVNALDVVSQEIISYRFGAGMTIREIAERLDIPFQTVNTKLRRALIRIRKSLDEKGIEYPF